MAAGRSSRERARRRSATAAGRRGTAPLALLLPAAAVVVLVAGAWYAFGSDASDGMPEEAVGSPAVQVLPGGPHTVRHSLARLPTPATPHPAGLPTLVWFSGTWCEFCHAMEPFAGATAGEFLGRLAFVEKSVDHARDDATNFRVRGTPTFVMLYAEGREVARFGFQRDAAAFRAALEAALAEIDS